MNETNKEVAASAGVFAVGVLVSRILGLFRDALTARYLPIDVRDAFFVAFRLPNVFRRIFGEGALSTSVTPVLMEILGSRPAHLTPGEVDPRLKELVAGVMSLLLVVTSTVSLLAIVFMEPLLSSLLSGLSYQVVPGKLALTVTLARIMFGFLVLVTMYAYFMALLHSVRKFAVAAFAPCLFNLSMIAAAFVSPHFAGGTVILAWAVIVGGCLQLLMVVPSVYKMGLLRSVSFRWESPDMWRVIKTILPGLFGLSVMQFTTVVNLHFASDLPAGSQTYLYLADRILELPLSLFVVSIGSVLLPTLARQWASGAKDEMRDSINHAIRLIVFVTVPAAIGMFVLAHPMTEVLFLGREFKYQEAVATGQIIQVYAFGMILLAGVRILAQGFYAIGNAWYPAFTGAVSLVSHVILAWALTRAFGLIGLAAAGIASAAVNVTMLGLAYNSWVGSLQMKKLLKTTLLVLLSSSVMVLILLCYQPLLDFAMSRYLRKTVLLLFIIFCAGGSYFGMAQLLRIPESAELWQIIKAKLRGRKTPALQ
jgi:putative peptidoglycan lipid II flippase